MRRGEMFRLRYGEGETGWAKWLGDGKARIANLPISGLLNIDDVVEVVEREDRLEIARVVSSVFACRTTVAYPEPFERNYWTLRGALEALDCKVEGMVEGLAVVAHQESVNPVAVLKKLGLKLRVVGRARSKRSRVK